MPHLPETENLHADLLELLKIFDLICRGNDVKYSLHGGTLLGCIREKGFIPWDDDVDISMRREEYNKFKKAICGNEKNRSICLEEKTNRFPQLWMKIEDHHPVWLDIFIWDYISENKFEQQLKIIGLSFFLAFLKTKETMYLSTESKRYTGIKHAFIWSGYQVGRFFPLEKKISWADRFSQKLGGDKKLIHRSNDLYAGMILILPSEVMQSYEYKDFEGVQLMVSSSYDQILISSYGTDYMVPKRMNNNAIIAHSLARETLYKG